MRSPLKVLGCLAILAIPLSLGVPVYAQQSGSTPANGSEDRAERQQFREEREKVRAEHEKLESEHDTLKMQCMDAKGQDRADCQQKKEALQQKQEALHQRMKALHEKMEADHGKNHPGQNHPDHKGEWKKHHDDMQKQGSKPAQPGGGPASATPSIPPAGGE